MKTMLPQNPFVHQLHEPAILAKLVVGHSQLIPAVSSKQSQTSHVPYFACPTFPLMKDLAVFYPRIETNFSSLV